MKQRKTPILRRYPVKISTQAWAPSAWLYAWPRLCCKVLDKLLNVSELSFLIFKMGTTGLTPEACDMTWETLNTETGPAIWCVYEFSITAYQMTVH